MPDHNGKLGVLLLCGEWRVECGVNVKTPESVDFDVNSTLQTQNSKLHQPPILHSKRGIMYILFDFDCSAAKPFEKR